ncbi:hypothetical protein CLV28_0362 [Sediminihabitans luteus]|uniref:DUF4190 domain-containing protein n=1 Tax=Sediminihabitans luteus TaxID=1138585 RepID=A0A2M9CZI1_9CELL|nr:hypothetical protein [Sediminihabitans luteus]PJJ77148.1 hypothetical protein CLV28_0362 [Sediminihabitans luteus]GII98596.1 hypothetical protein Slu03_09740 [Sediminihabitans luteus]
MTDPQDPYRPPPPGATPPARPTPHRAPVVERPAGPPTPEPDAEPDPEVVRASLRAVFRFGLWMVLTVLLVGAPLPWGALAVVTTVVAAVMGVRALVAHRRARLRGGLGVALAVGLGLTGFLGMESAGRLLTWEIQTTLQECQAGAITVQAADACQSAYESSLEGFLTDLGDARP